MQIFDVRRCKSCINLNKRRMIHYTLKDAYRWAPSGCCAWQHYKENTVRYSRHCTISFQIETHTCVRHMGSHELDQEFILCLKHFVFYSSKAEVLNIHFFPPLVTQHKGGGTRYNWMGDIRLHFRGVEGIEFPSFLHLRTHRSRRPSA